MDLNKIYHIINEILDVYITEGVKPEHLLSFLNADEDNYKFLFNKVYRKLNMENVQFESTVLTECLQDSIRDKVAMLNDMSVATNESSNALTKEPELQKTTYSSLSKWRNAAFKAGHKSQLQMSKDYRYWIAYSDDDITVKGFFTIEEPYDENKPDYSGHGYIINE